MRFQIPKIVRPLALTDYAPELVNPDTSQPMLVYVWVNPPRDLWRERTAIFEERRDLRAVADDKRDNAWAHRFVELGQRAARFFATLWSAHADAATHWTEQDVIALSGNDTDPALYTWLTTRTIEMIDAHKASTLGK